MTKTTLHNIIDEYFEKTVESSEDSGLVYYDSFLRTWEEVSHNLTQFGVNYTINEVMSDAFRGEDDYWDEELIHEIERYIKEVLEPLYRKWSTPTTQRGL